MKAARGTLRRSLLWLVCMVLACLTAEAGQSALLTPEEQAWLAANPDKLILWFDHDYPPIEFMAPDGSFTGFGADIMALIENRLGVTFTKVPSRDWARQLASLESGESAIAPAIVRTPEREAFAFFSPPYITIPAVIITRRDEADIFGPDDLAGHRVAVVQGFVSQSHLRERYGDALERVAVRNVPEGLRAVSVGMADAMVENMAVAAYYIDTEKLPNLKVAGVMDLRYEQGFAVSKKYPLLFSAMQKAMADISREEMQRLEKKWIRLERPALSPEMIALLRYGGIFVGAVLVSLAAMSWWLKRRLAEKREELARTGRELHEKAARLNLALEAGNDGLWDWDVPSGTAFFSPRYYTMLGYEPGEFGASYDSWRSMLHPDDLERAEKAIRDSLDTGRSYESEFRMRAKSGEWVWVLSRGRVIERDGSGAPLRLAGTHVDLSERKRAEERLAHSETFFKAIVNNAMEAILIVQGERLVFANQRLARMLGVGLDELLVRPFADFVHPGDREMVSLRHAARLSGQTVPPEYDFRVTTAGGEMLWVMISLVPFEWDGQPATLAMLTDITQRKLAEEALRETEARYRDIFENAPVAIFRATPAGRFVVVNPAYAAMAGFSSPQAMIEGITDIAAQMYDNPDDREVYKRLLDEHGAVRDFEARLKRHGGGIFWASMTSRTVRDATGAVISYDGFLADVTERKEAVEALRLARDTLELQVRARTMALSEANERLVDLDRQRASFLSSASHELRTPLTSVLGFAKLAGRTFRRHFLPLADEHGPLRGKAGIIMENLSIIEQEGERLTRLINDLLDLNKIEAGRMVWRDAVLDVAREMETAAKAMQGAFAAKPGVRFSLQLAEDAGTARIDRDRLRQMVLNLLSNAIKYTDSGTVRLYAGSLPGGGLRIAVADTGAGIAEKDRDRVFQKFYQAGAANPDDAKPSGTGLGLAICKNIVEHYGGDIRVESRLGHGSTFIADFPPAIRP